MHPPPTDPIASHDDVVLRMEGIRKTYPGVVALADVELVLRRGEVHVLLGENGAGKSTLVKILAGATAKDAGRIVVGGEAVEIAGPRHARELGIAVIHQELRLVPALDAAANIFLGREPRRVPGIVDRRAMRARALALLDRLGATFDPDVPVGSLRVAEQQMVEIAKALSLDARVLVMDEPTSALTERETRTLFAVVRSLIAGGVAVVYISHRLDEIFEIGDRVTVLRDGRRVATRAIGEADRRELVRLMADREVEERLPKSIVARGPELLRVEGLGRRGVLHDIGFSVHAGEVVGIAGLLGSGRTEVARAVFGLDRPQTGRILVRGRPRRIRSPREAIRAGIGFVTEDRKREGLVLGLTVRDNIALPVLRLLARLGVVRGAAERALAARSIRDLRIRTTGAEQRVLDLSGGNQQKVVLAKWLASRVDVLFLDEPTRGIDVGAKQEIYQLIDRLVEDGLGVVLISSELPEVVGLADRVLVMREGRVAGEFGRAEATQERVLACAVGA